MIQEPGPPRRPPRNYRAIALSAVPLMVATLALLASSVGNLSRSPGDLEHVANEMPAAFETVCTDLRRVASNALATSPAEALDLAAPQRMADRIEGVGVVDSNGRWESWRGTPAEPDAFDDLGTTDWAVHAEGARTRLVARAGPDSTGRIGIVTLVLASAIDEASFHRLLPPHALQGARATFYFGEGHAARAAATPLEGARRIDLRDPDSAVRGTAFLVEERRQPWVAGDIARALALGLATLLLLAGTLFRWDRLCRQTPGALTALAVVTVGRFTLLVTDTADVLLPRELGGPGLFGTVAMGGLLFSPADLLLTGLAVYLVAVVARIWLCERGGQRPLGALAASFALAVLFSWATIAVCIPLVRDAQMPLLHRRALLEGDARLVLLIGLVFFILAAAELWGLAWSLVRTRPGRELRLRRVGVAIATLFLAAAASAMLQWLGIEMALEGLRAEYARQLPEQDDRRQAALEDAVLHVRDSYANAAQPVQAAGVRDDLLAYQFWVSSELFNAGYRSSLAFLSPQGHTLSEFGFGVPAFDDGIELRPTPSRDVKIDNVTSDQLSARHLIRAEVSVFSGDTAIGTVVGHVINEPDNLPFLPWNRPYLNALGAGRPGRLARSPARDPEYVLYDENKLVRVTTLTQPPPLTPDLLAGAEDESRIEVMSGAERFVGIAIGNVGRLHLLLVPTRTRLEKLSAAVRLAVVALLMLGLIGLFPRLLHPPLWPAQLQVLRHSFYRKLLAATLVASVVPLIGVTLFLRGYVERRGDDDLNDAAIQTVRVAQRILADYITTAAVPGSAQIPVNEHTLHWLRDLVGQEVHLYADGRLHASSAKELFTSGLVPERLDGIVHERVTVEDRPYLVRQTTLGNATIPVAYAPVHVGGMTQDLVVAVPIVFEEREIARSTDRLIEVILLATVLLVGLLATAAAVLARAVARPVRELVGATAKIASGDYDMRLEPRTDDEMGELVHRFNTMASALSQQRSDLEARREYMERLLRYATTGVISADTAGRLVTLNPAAHELLDPEGRLLRVGTDLIAGLEANDEFRPLAHALRDAGDRRGESVDVDLDARGKPRRLRFVRINLREPSGRLSGTLILIDDVTELMRSNQLAAWAEMARAIAHEIKNPLTPVQLSTDHLRRILQDRGVLPAAEIEACLSTITNQVRALHDIAGEFATFSTLPVLATESANPVELMREVITPYRVSNPPGVTIVECYESVDAVSVDHKVLSRAVVNLIENALQAMPDGGTLRVGVSPRDGLPEVALTVTDTGVGFSDEARRRLFEPYFSTKSSGTGLGLAIVRRAAEAHRGRLEVESEPNRGTTVRIVLPSISAPPRPA